MLRKEMIRSNLLRDQGCVFSCQQLMKQECQSTGESKSGQKEGRRRKKSVPKKAIALIEAPDKKRKFVAATDC
jgi:competence transcription factor ComK